MSSSAASAGARYALRELHRRHAVPVPLALVVSTLLLLVGLSLPLLHARQMIFWKSSYSVWAGVVALWEANELLLALVLFFFSIIFPAIKLAALAVIWFVKLPEERRQGLLHWLGLLGKWSMLDVFVVAILIVLIKIGPLAKVEPRAGVYVFSLAIMASMLTTVYIDRLTRRSIRRRDRA
jgi:paraquat-inducible protein A